MKRHFLFPIGCLTLMALAFSVPAMADEAELLSMIKSMQERMDAQDRKIQMLESRGASVAMAPTGEVGAQGDEEFAARLEKATGGGSKWLKDLSFKGDLRLRYEAFHNAETTDDRNRFRYRLRFEWDKKFNRDMKIGFGLASGEQAFGTTTLGDNVSTNTTFNNNFAGKQINIVKAFATYTPSFLKRGPVENVSVTAGKQSNAFERGSSDIIWDGDVTPEGLTETMDLKLLDTEDFDLKSYFQAGQFVLNETGTIGGGDAELFAFQGGLNAMITTPLSEKPVEWLTAASFYNWHDYARNSEFIIGGTSLARGNFNIDGVATELDAGDFNVWEVYNEVKLSVLGIALTPYLDWAVNTANQRVGDADSYAWALGAKLGKAKKKGDWEIGYAYKRIGADSTPGFNDADFGFSGHSGKRGSVIKGAYAVTDNIHFNTAAFFVNNLNAGTGTVIDENQSRFQVDLVWKF